MTRIAYTYYFLFNIIAACFFAVYLYVSYLQEKSLVIERTKLTSLLISEWIKGAFNTSDYVLRDIVERVPVSELKYPAQNSLEHARISAFINKKSKILPYISGVGLNDNKCIITHGSSIIGFDASEREWCYIPMKNSNMDTYVSNMFMSNINEMMVVQSRKFPDNKGLAGLGVNLDFFSQWIKKVSVGKNGVVAISDAHLNLVARKPELPDMLGKKVSSPVFNRLISSEEPYQSYSGSSPLDSEDRLYSIRKIDNLPFFVIVGEANRDWLGSWHKQIVISILITFLLWGMAWVILQHYLRIVSQKKELEEISVTDQLTNLYNRHKLNEVLESEINRSERVNYIFGLIILDIDNFKDVNDIHGHNVGDSVLIELSLLLKKSLRVSDTLGRWGGEEFVIIVPQGDNGRERALAEKLRVAVEKHTFTTVAKMTASFGVATYRKGESINSLIKRADDGLYQAKKNGRNQVGVENV